MEPVLDFCGIEALRVAAHGRYSYIISAQLAYYLYTNYHFVLEFFFFFQAEDGIRDKLVTGVQTCALPISFRIGDHAFVRNPRGAKTFLQRAARPIVSRGAESFGLRTERREVRGNVARAAQTFTLLHEIHNGNCRFRRQTRRGSPKVAVQHQVAEHTHAFAAQARDQSFQTSYGIGDIRGHADSLIFSFLPDYSSAIFASSGSMTGMSSRTG